MVSASHSLAFSNVHSFVGHWGSIYSNDGNIPSSLRRHRASNSSPLISGSSFYFRFVNLILASREKWNLGF